MQKKRSAKSLLPFIFLIAVFVSLSGCGGDWRGFPGSFFTGMENVFSGSATLNWEPPSSNIDGSPTSDIAGYVIYYGYTSNSYNDWIDVGNVTSYTLSNLPPGTCYFALTAYDITGQESALSNEMNKTIQ